MTKTSNHPQAYTKNNVCVVGGGSWGTALAHLCSEAGFHTRLWARDQEVLTSIQERHENTRYLPGLRLHPALETISHLDQAVAWADWIVCSVPTQAIRQVFAPLARTLAGKRLVNASKGIEIQTRLRVSQIFADIAPDTEYLVLSGPSFAEETIKGMPTLVTLASTHEAAASELHARLRTKWFRCYTTTDVAGVECAGAMKNVIAIASGMVAGLGFGFNTQAAVINRGLAEITKLGVRIGGNPLTFLGLAGMGDLILTCTGSLSRNRKLGLLLGQGLTLDDVKHKLGGVAEGFYTTKAAFDFSNELGVEMPILSEVHGILYGHTTPKAAVEALMARDTRDEWDGIDAS